MAHKKKPKNGGTEEQGRELMPLSTFLPGIVDTMKLVPSPPPPKALTPQAKHHYTTTKQIDDLLELRDGSPDIGFMTRLLTLCSLPRTDPGDRLQYVRKNGPYTLGMMAGINNKLPYGPYPRLLLAWVCTEAVRTQSRELNLGQSLAEFMRQIGMNSDTGGKNGNRTNLRKQIDRLFSCNVELVHISKGHKQGISSLIADERDLWWDYKSPTQDTLWQSRVRLGEKLYEEIVKNHVPIDMDILKAMSRSSLGLDLYMWLSYKTFRLYISKDQKPERYSWHSLYGQFGSNPAKVGDRVTVDSFRKDVLREMRKLKRGWPTLDFDTPKGFLEVRPCMPSIPPKALPASATGGA